LVFETNKLRIRRDNEVVSRELFNQSPLRFGSLDKQNPDYNSLADFYADIDSNTIEIRIPYFLLNITDPSQALILNSSDAEKFDAKRTEGFYFYAVSYKPDENGLQVFVPSFAESTEDNNKEEAVLISDALPVISDESILTESDSVNAYSWAKWQEPHYYFELKDSYYIVQEEFEDGKN
jgi:hypothetical protein